MGISPGLKRRKKNPIITSESSPLEWNWLFWGGMNVILDSQAEQWDSGREFCPLLFFGNIESMDWLDRRGVTGAQNGDSKDHQASGSL